MLRRVIADISQPFCRIDAGILFAVKLTAKASLIVAEKFDRQNFITHNAEDIVDDLFLLVFLKVAVLRGEFDDLFRESRRSVLIVICLRKYGDRFAVLTIGDGQLIFAYDHARVIRLYGVAYRIKKGQGAPSFFIMCGSKAQRSQALFRCPNSIPRFLCRQRTRGNGM